jgi:hypothetical protein
MAGFSTSDIIAIVAIVVSGTVSVVTLFVNFLTNNANNRANLIEKMFEKRVEALREFYEILSEYVIAADKIVASVLILKMDEELDKNHPETRWNSNITVDTIRQDIRDFIQIETNLNKIFHKNRVFFTKTY